MSLIFALFWIGVIVIAAIMVVQLIATLVVGAVVAIGSSFVWLFKKLRKIG